MIDGDAYLPVTTNPAYVTATMPDDGSSVFPTALVVDEARGINWEGGAASFIDGLASDYSDMQVTLADGETPVPFGVEEFSQLYGSRKIVAHMGIPSLSASTITELLLWRGIPGGPHEDRNGVYANSDGYCGVWPLNEQNIGAPGGTGTDVYADWTGNTSPGKDYVSNMGKDGVIGKGQQFSGKTSGGTDRIVVPYSSNLDTPNAITISLWVYPLSDGDGASVIECITGRDSINKKGWMIFQGGRSYDELRVMMYYAPEIGSWMDFRITDVFSMNIWTHVAITYKYVGMGTSIVATYVNGQQVFYRNDRNGPLTSYNNDLWIGAREYTGSENYFDGAIDDLQLHRVARSENWIKTNYNISINNSVFWTIGEEVIFTTRFPAAHRSKNFKMGPKLVYVGGK